MPRPSSPVGTKAFTVRPYLLHHIAKAVTTSTIPQSPFVTYCIVSLLGMHVYLVFCSCCSTTHFVGKRLLLSNRFLCHADVNFRFPSIIDLLVGLTGLEPVTPRLSSACSNQLSYRPGFGSLSRNWWRHGDSNPGHPACKAGALPTELCPQNLGHRPACHSKMALGLEGVRQDFACAGFTLPSRCRGAGSLERR